MKSLFSRVGWCLVLGAAVACRAVLVDFTLRYDELTLKTGKTLKNITLKTYDTATGKVGAQSGQMLLTLRLDQLPEAAATAVKARVPALSEEEMTAEQARVAREEQEAARKAAEREKKIERQADADREAQRALDVRAAEKRQDAQAAKEKQVADAAESLALFHFKYEADRYSSQGIVFGTDVVTEEPEVVSGWPNRWRVRGKVGVQYLTRNNEGSGRNSREFEMLIEAPDKGKPKLIDLTVK